MTPDRTSDPTEIRNSWDDDAAAAHPRPADRAPEAGSCSPECAAMRDQLHGATHLAMSALTAALTTMQEAARLPEGHEDDADLLHETVAMLPVQIDRLTQERDEARATIAHVEAFINQRPEFIKALMGTSGGDEQTDYHRWQGHAEARRHLATRLGVPVPHHPGETVALAPTDSDEPCHPEHREHPLTGGKVGKAAQTPGGGDIWEPCSTDSDGGES